MKLLVTGSSGFIGSHLTALLSEKGHEVVGLDTKDQTLDFGVSRFFIGDVRVKDTVMPALAGVECVIHLAATHFDYGHTAEEYWDTNQNGTRELMAAVREAAVDKVIFYSTIAVYGDRYDESSEQTKPSPTSPYGESKLAAEQCVRRWAEEHPQRSAVIVRLCAVYGERNITNMNNLIRQIDSGFFITVGSGDNIKAIAYVGNVVQATLHCLERMAPGVRTFNYADKPDLTVSEIIPIIYDELGKKPPRLAFPLWLAVLAAIPFDLLAKLMGRDLPVNVNRVKKLTLPTRINAQAIRDYGVEQVFTTEEGLRRTVRYHLAQKNRAKGK